MSGIHPEAAMSYADQLHRDIQLAELVGLVLDGQRAVAVKTWTRPARY